MATKKKAEQFVITRGSQTGVQCGYLVSDTAAGVVLREARQIWRFGGAETLQEVAAKGASMTEKTRISQPAPALSTLRRDDVASIIECSAEAEGNLRQSRWL
ncbi:MAG TPA: hypothetical protein VFP50_15430 [Anaeromyxobacteraceae bacterium]|nr:hypothetical protein [Anaeromyxobacteraceae bacterium]